MVPALNRTCCNLSTTVSSDCAWLEEWYLFIRKMNFSGEAERNLIIVEEMFHEENGDMDGMHGKAPRAGYQQIARFLQTLGFSVTRSDASLFVYRHGDTTAYLLLYVDDIILTASSAALLQQITLRLRDEFAIKNLGALHYFLGIEVVRRPDAELGCDARDVIGERFGRGGGRRNGGPTEAGVTDGVPTCHSASTAKVVTAAASGARRWLRDSTSRLAATTTATAARGERADDHADGSAAVAVAVAGAVEDPEAVVSQPLWIIFKRDMVITLSQELIMNSFKTIDGRGANVHIANGACITIQYVTNVIIHGLHIHDCRPTGNAMVRSSPSHYGWRTMADGDAVSIFGASHVWVDHCSLSNCADGLVDAIMGSTAITVSNNYFTHHNEVMLLGHSDSYLKDKAMQVTIAFNHFGEGLIQRMPRHGYFHVVNNDYTHWEMYAIGGSAEPTINSQGNRYLAPTNPFAKEVTKRVETAQTTWKAWNWRSEGDMLLNGAFFTPSGAGASASYSRASSLGAKSSSMVATITSGAGALSCHKGSSC
ncbi:hypothetical protein TRIUR3_22914 [Triticum urartu]|uniref:Pectate lyase n=1 Tax=Triticum urartu TaxID=4572 RepID=M7ZWY0_TRIUA|nr:hypothetical protein TRIUR3_22914 [Triticum urartu]